MSSEHLSNATGYTQSTSGISALSGGVSHDAFNLTEGPNRGLDAGWPNGNYGPSYLLDEATISAMDFEAYYKF